jgi:acyl dehydratase
MSINPSAVGAQTGPFSAQWTAVDCMRYAMTVGACMDDPLGDELGYVTENTKGVALQALPTMCTVLGGVLDAPSPLAQIGDYDRRMSVQGSVEVLLHRPLPACGSVTSTVTVDGIYDKKRGALVSLVVAATDSESGQPVFNVRNGIFIRGEGGWGGDPGPDWPAAATPERAPDQIVIQTPRPEQPLLYRLNGDHNPLHSDPGVARAAGFKRPIMHGLCTFGFVGRAVLREMLGGNPAAIAAIGCRFAAPALPGEPLESRFWNEGDQLLFTTSGASGPVLTGGYVQRRTS